MAPNGSGCGWRGQVGCAAEKYLRISKTEELTQFPSMSRDIALVLAESVPHEDVVKLIKKANPKDLESFGLFDVYQGKGVEKGKKSLAYSFVYRSAKQTLTDKKSE